MLAPSALHLSSQMSATRIEETPEHLLVIIALGRMKWISKIFLCFSMKRIEKI